MDELLPPLPPQDEFDDTGRHVHPYVRDPEPDLSAPGFVNGRGQEVSQEFRSRESRLTSHAIEEMLGHLTPMGYACLIQACVHRLYTPALEEAMTEQGLTPEGLDPRGELMPFEDLHRSRLKQMFELSEEIVATCPNCGRRHDRKDGLQPGGYVNTQTGDRAVIAPWNELTPGAQQAARAELEELLRRAPGQRNVPVVRRLLSEKPELIPETLERMRREVGGDRAGA